MSSSHDALYRAICAHPDEDTPRLAFADLIEEDGEQLRAQFIRTQVALANLPTYDPAWVNARQFEQDAATGWSMAHTLPKVPVGYGWHRFEFRRGFPWKVGVRSWAEFWDAGDAVFDAAPIRALDIGVQDADLSDFSNWPHLTRIRKLEVSDGWNNELNIIHLAESEYATALNSLGFERDGLAPDGLTALAGSPLFTRLTELELRSISTPSALLVDSLGAAREPGALSRLSLPYNHLGHDDAAHLFALPVMHALQHLDVSDNPFGPDGVAALAESGVIRGLRVLNLSKTGPGVPGVKALTEAGGLAGLRMLDLSDNRLGPVAVKVLAGCGGFRGLRVLNLTNNPVGDAGAGALAESRALSSLLELDLRDASVGHAGAIALAESPHLNSLLRLDLRNRDNRPLADAARAALEERFGDRVRLYNAPIIAMTDRDALYRAILDRPDDDTLRLVYADALEESGDPQRAACVREQVELSQLPEYAPRAVQVRYHERTFNPRWTAELELPDGFDWAREPFRRGLPGAVQADNGAVFVAHADEVFTRYPIEALELSVVRVADTREFAECSWLTRLASLTLVQGAGGGGITRLLASPLLTRLTELRVGSELTTPNAVTAVVRSRVFKQLTSLAVRRDRNAGGNLAGELARLAKPPRLKKLDLSANWLTADAIERLVASPAADPVEELDLSDNHLGAEGTTALAEGALPNLRVLSMLSTGPREEGVAALAAAPLFRELRSLSLGVNNLGPTAATAIANAPADNLRVLKLHDNRIGDRGAITLAESPHLANLVLLDLAESHISDAGAEALADSPHLGGLIYLNLYGNLITDRTAARLRERFGTRVYPQAHPE